MCCGQMSEESMTMPVVERITLHGSLTIQNLLQVANPSDVVAGILYLSRDELLLLTCDMSGCRVFIQFMKSTTVSAKNKESLLAKLKVSTSITVSLRC